MGLAETLAAQVTAAFNTVGNLKRPVTLHQQTSGSYDAATGAVSRTTATHTVQALVLSPTRKDLEDPRVRATDTMILIDAADIPGVVPQLGQRIVDGSIDYDIAVAKGIGPNANGPALAWKLACRRPSAEGA